MLSIRYRLSQLALLLVCVVVVLGAFTRLTDAGLGCPDWPGCYGFLTVPTGAEELHVANSAYPERPVEASKARNEMVHRYFAGGLGLIVLLMWVMSLKAKQQTKLSTLLLATVTFQAVLGMWTVTMNLMPLVVMGHLLGGFTTFSLILIMCLRQRHQLKIANQEVAEYSERLANDIYLTYLIKIAAVVLITQIALGGWTAANYAAVACTDLPICEPGWQSKFDLQSALSVPTGHSSYEYGVFPFEARMTIHVLHRIGALIASAVLVILLVRLFKYRETRGYGLVLSVLLATQISLGISNVVFHLPLGVAVAHNFVGLLLLASLVSIWHSVYVHNRITSPVHFSQTSASAVIAKQGA